jgi:signal peptide peptidase SppA
MTDIPYHRICGQFFNRPLWLLPSTAQTIGSFLLSRVDRAAGGGRGGENDAGSSMQFFKPIYHADGTAESHTPRASRFYGDYPVDPESNGRPRPYRRTPDGIAIITVVGELVNRGAYVGASSGVVSYEGIKFQLMQAAADPRTIAIILDLESPGGEAVGAFEAAAVVRQVASIKPVHAVVNGMAASAGYALASGASRITTMPTGISGSIGVVMLHLDFSKYLEEEGIKPTFIFAGAHKVDGNVYEPLPENVRQRMQGEISSFYDQFIETVAAGRRAMTADQIRGTGALVFKGQDAVDIGLADAVGTFEEVLADLTTAAKTRATSASKGSFMTKQAGEPGASIPETAPAAVAPAQEAQRTETVAELTAAYPSLVAQIRTDAANAERARILGIEAIAVAGHDDLIKQCKADGKTTPEQAAMQILTAEKGIRRAQMSAIQGVEAVASQVPAAPASISAAEQTATASTPEAWADEYKANTAHGEKLRAEFPTAEGYVAFRKAEASGRVRRLVNRNA